MKVQVINESGKPQKMLLGIHTTEAEFQEYTNKITGKPDPMIVYAPRRFVHMSTVHRYGFKVKNLKTGDIIEIPDLNQSNGAVMRKDWLPE